MEKDFSSWWKEVREDVSNYLQARGKLTKIQAYEKIAKVTSVIISFLILAFLVGFVIIFLLLMIGSWVAQLTNSTTIGVSSVAVLVIGFFIFLAAKRKSVLERPITGWIIQALYDEEDFLDDTNDLNSDGEED